LGTDSAFQIRPGTKFELEAPGDIRFGQVALDATLVDQKRTSLRMTHVRLHDHDGEDDAADDEDEEQHGKATVTLANLIPGVVSALFIAFAFSRGFQKWVRSVHRTGLTIRSVSSRALVMPSRLSLTDATPID
jgi:hypothetical protein